METKDSLNAIELKSIVEAMIKLPVLGSPPSASSLPPGKLQPVDDGTHKRLYYNFNGTLAYIEFTEA